MESTVTCALCESLGSNDKNFLLHTNQTKSNHARVHFVYSTILDDEITEDEVFQRCFTTIRQPKLEHSAMSRSKCRKSLLNLCKSLFQHQSKSTSVVCNMCGSGISTKDKNYMINHASAHLEVKLFECRHCDCSSSQTTSIVRHIRRVHNIGMPTKEDFEDKIDEHLDEVSDRIKHCFSASLPRASGVKRQFIIKSNSQDKSHLSVTHLCRSIFIQRSKPSSLNCSLCGSPVSVRNKGAVGFNASTMFGHAAAHLDVKLFVCRHCDQPTSTKAAMRTHLKKMHQIVNGSSQDFDDRSTKFHSEYLSMIERCFSAVQVKREVQTLETKATIKAEASVRNLTNGSKLTVERHLFYNQLMRRIVDADGKVKCSICSKRITIRHSRQVINQFASYHAEMHLQKPLYRCKVCGVPCSTHPAVVGHLKTKHALGLLKNYECVADEFHGEIMTMLSKCYGVENC